MTTRLPQADWRAREGLDALLDALGVEAGETRFVGGAVRDTLLRLAVHDIDLATRLLPDNVLARLKTAGIKAIPTGLAHGTITAVLPQGPVEITTLRRDVSTDGRRATVAYTDDWQEDAARRDFTINALSADPLSGEICDYFGGLEDLKSGRVRFIRDPLTRIAEDHLRIMRFFRFQARFGKGVPDEAALSACAARARDLMALSRERIADELLKLLALPDPSPTVKLMIAHGIFTPVLPEITQVEGLEQLEATEEAHHAPPVALRRLAALLPADPVLADSVGARLKLSKAQRKILFTLGGRNAEDAISPHALAYWVGIERARDRLLLGGYPQDTLNNWTPPRFPLSGGDLIARGLASGPIVTITLKAIELKWVAAGFPPQPILEQFISEALTASR